jgi:ABC-2 type transport system ATP-binding protein
MIAGLLELSGGEILVGGHSVTHDKQAVLKQIGYMPDYFGVYPDLLVREYLDFFAACYHIPENRRSSLVAELLELVDLSHRRDDPVDRLSRGMKQRLSLARALLHDPQVLLLDEPASGLDPRARVEIRELLVEMARMGKTVFFSTHILADVAEICTQVGILEEGRLVAQGSLEQLHLQIVPRRLVEITLLGEAERAQSLLEARPEVSSLEALSPALASESRNGARTRLAFEFNGEDAALSQLLAELVRQGLPVLHFSEDQRDLEEVFLRATKGVVT